MLYTNLTRDFGKSICIFDYIYVLFLSRNHITYIIYCSSLMRVLNYSLKNIPK